MVAGAPEPLRWVEDLTPPQLRQFAAELANALTDRSLRDDDGSLALLLDDWEATAEVASSPEVVAELRRRKDYRPLASFAG